MQSIALNHSGLALYYAINSTLFVHILCANNLNVFTRCYLIKCFNFYVKYVKCVRLVRLWQATRLFRRAVVKSREVDITRAVPGNQLVT
jgi:hypothetical protein